MTGLQVHGLGLEVRTLVLGSYRSSRLLENAMHDAIDIKIKTVDISAVHKGKRKATGMASVKSVLSRRATFELVAESLG